MKEAGKKSRVIEVYSLIFIDLLCTGVAFGLSAFLRQVYDVNRTSWTEEVHYWDVYYPYCVAVCIIFW